MEEENERRESRGNRQEKRVWRRQTAGKGVDHSNDLHVVMVLVFMNEAKC